MNKLSHPLLQDLSPEDVESLGGLLFKETHQNSDMNGKEIFLTENMEAGEVIATVYGKKINNLMQKNGARFKNDLFMVRHFLSDKERYFDERFCFFTPERDLHIGFSARQAKQLLRDRVIYFIDELNSASVTECGQAVFEELYMNAVFDAPQEAEKKNMPDNNKESEFYLASGAGTLQISCTDYFGSLDIGKLLGRMDEVYKKGVGEAINLRNTEGGAGIGCVILFENSMSLTIGVEAGQKTKVTCLLPLGVSNRQREKIKKSIHWFQI